MGLELRDYQKDLLADIRQAWTAKDRVIAQLATGGGKTEIATAEVQARVQAGEDVVFLVHRDNLVEQTVLRMRNYGIPANPGSGSLSVWKPGKQRPAGVMALCVQTYKRRLRDGLDPKRDYLLIVDECHWYGDGVGFGPTLEEHWGQILGLTATPYRTNPKEGFAPTWEWLVTGPGMQELIDRGALCDYALFPLRLSVWFSITDKGIKLMEGGKEVADLTAASKLSGDRLNVEKIEAERKRDGNLRAALGSEAVDIWHNFDRAPQGRLADRPTIFFAYSVPHAKELTDLIKAKGVPAGLILGETPAAERSRVLEQFREKGGALVSVDVLKEGFDAPDAGCIVITRPTDSLAMYRQMIGRGMRPKDGSRGYGNCVILDLADNVFTHGDPAEDIAWSLDPREKKDEKRLQMEDGGYICGYEVEFDEEGYILGDGSGKKGELATVGGGCGAFLSPGAHSCRACGAQRGRHCRPEAHDGCGRFRVWSGWTGKYRKWRMGGCDACGHESYVAALAAEQEAWQLAEKELFWRPAKSGNGMTAWVRLGSGVTVWTGMSKRDGCHRWAVMLRDEADPGVREALLPLVGRRNTWGYAQSDVEEQAQDAVIEALTDDQYLAVFGVRCSACRRERHDPKWSTCFNCSAAGGGWGEAEETAAEPLPESPPIGNGGGFRGEVVSQAPLTPEMPQNAFQGINCWLTGNPLEPHGACPDCYELGFTDCREDAAFKVAAD